MRCSQLSRTTRRRRVAERLDESVDHRTAGLVADAEGCGDLSGHELGIRQRGQVHEPDAVARSVEELG